MHSSHSHHRLSSECSRLSTGYNRVAVVTCQIVTRSSNYPAAGWREASDGETRLLADRVQRVLRKRSGTRSCSREWCRGENRCDRGRTLPEYFTDDPVVVKTVVIRGLAIKSHAGVARRRRPRPKPVAVPLYSLLFSVSDRPRREQHNVEASHSNVGGLPSFALLVKLARRVVASNRGSRYRFNQE